MCELALSDKLLRILYLCGFAGVLPAVVLRLPVALFRLLFIAIFNLMTSDMPNPNDYAAYPEYPLTGRMRLAYDWIPAGTHSLLDAGCSWGYATRFFAEKCSETSGIEISDDVEIARKRYPHIDFHRGGLESTPFADASFDVIVMSDVLEHVDDEIAALNEMARILRPGGTFIVSTPHRGLFQWLDPYNYGYALHRTAPPLYRMAYKLKNGAAPDPALAPVKHRHYSLGDFRAMLDRSRFGGQYSIANVFRSSLVLEPLAINAEVCAQALIGKRASALLKPLDALGQLDYRIPYGALAFNIALRIVKTS